MSQGARWAVRVGAVVALGAAVAAILAAPPEGQQAAIPNQWSFAKDGIEKFPLLDFTPQGDAGKPQPGDPEADRQMEELFRRFNERANEKKWPEARRVVDEALKKLERHPRMGELFNNYVNRLAEDKGKKDETIAACREMIRRFPRYAWSAYHCIQRITESQLYFYTSGTTSVEPGAKALMHLNGNNIPEVKFALYKLDLFGMIDKGLSILAPSVPQGAKPVKEWTQAMKRRDRSWFSENVEIPLPEAGAYLLTLGTEHYQWTTLLFASRLAVATKGDGRILMAYASNVRDGKAPGACEIAILDNTRVVHRGTTNADGLFVGRVKGQAQNSLVVVRRGDDWAVSNAQSYWHPYSYGQILIYTDRPVYRPKQTVHAKFLVRRFNFETDRFDFKPDEELQVFIRDPKYNEVLKRTLKTNEFGAADLSMVLGDEPPLGYYNVQVSGPNGYGYGYFMVEEYKKPEYEVEVKADKTHAIFGDKVNLAVSARYYFGEPVKDAEVSYEVYANPYWYYYPWHRGRYAHYYWFAEEFYSRDRPHVGGSLIAQGQGRLNDQGKIEIAVDSDKVPKQEGYDYNLTVRASVTDKSRRQIQGYGFVRLARAGVQLAIHADRYSYRPSDKVVVDIRTTDLDDKGVTTAINLDVHRQDQNGNHVKQHSEVVETNKDGDATYTFIPDQNGYFRIEASAKDQAGNKVTQNLHLWVAAEGWHSPYRYSGVEIKTDREMYQPGDKAQVLITTGYVNHPALITVEADRIDSYRLARFNGSLMTFDLAVEKSFAPTATVSATLFAQGTYVAQQRMLVVPPADKWLKIAVATDKPQYKPGESATYSLTLTDHQDKPVLAELSFGLVDEAIYAIQPDRSPDIRKFYYGQRRRYIYTQTSFWFRAMGLGGAEAKEAANQGAAAPGEKSAAPTAEPPAKSAPGRALRDGKAGEDAEGALVQPRVRTDFADSAVWLPALRTDKDGKVSVPFKMPDNLTTWRAKIVAFTKDGLVGQEVHKVITRQNLMVRLECPRKFTERDEVTVSAVVHNYLAAAKRCVLSIKNDGGVLTRSEREVTLEVPSGGDRRVDWLLRVDTHRPIKLAVAALTGEESDAMELTIPVIPHGLKMLEADAGSVEEKASVALTLPADAEQKKALLRISMAPSLAATMFESLEYLANYPYGCVEQTMSRFLPTVVVANVLQKLGMRNAKLEENLPKYVEAGLQRLYGFQHDDGSWGWWKQDKANGYMTAYVLYGLGQARAADFAVSDNVLSRGLDCLRKAIPDEKDVDTRAYMTFSYAQLRTPEAKWVSELFDQREKLNDYAVALLALTCQKANEAERPAELIKLLEGRAQLTKTACRWGKGESYHWQSNSIQATAYALKALVAANPKHPLIPKAVNWLVVQRRDNCWYSTKDTAAAIFALADNMKASGELNPDYEAALSVNGKQVKTFRVAGNALELKPTVVELAADQIVVGQNTIELTKNGKGNLHYSCALEFYTKGEDFAAKSAGLSVKREYFRLIPKQQANVIVFDRQPLGREVKGGQEIEVRVTVEADKPYQYFILEDMLPSGCEVVEDKSDLDARWRHWWAYCSNREARDTRMVFFSSYLAAAKTIFVYTLRAETPGEFHVMPAVASLMYQPDVRGTSAEDRLTIFEK
ncbi:MAG: hypothetical protein FJ291_01455 [Planctomycetes bacterium]|nr:hypothetical protein [Planctomycetota bacterium]